MYITLPGYLGPVENVKCHQKQQAKVILPKNMERSRWHLLGKHRNSGKGGRTGEGEFKGMTRLPHSKEQNKHNQVNADLGSTRTLPAPSLTGI